MFTWANPPTWAKVPNWARTNIDMDKSPSIQLHHLVSKRLQLEPPVVDAPDTNGVPTQEQFELEIELAWCDQVH